MRLNFLLPTRVETFYYRVKIHSPLTQVPPALCRPERRRAASTDRQRGQGLQQVVTQYKANVML